MPLSIKKLSYNKLLWCLFYLLLFALLLNTGLNHLDPDLGWHLKVGEDIIDSRAVPGLELYNYTLEGESWVDHEWFLNALSFLIYKNFNYIGLCLFFASLAFLAIFLLNKFILKYFVNKLDFPATAFIMGIELLGVIAMAPHLGVRMQVITILNLILLLFILESFCRKKNRWQLLLMIPLIYFWSIAHGGYLMGICLMFFFLGLKFIERYLVKIKLFSFLSQDFLLSFKNLAYFFLISLFALISTLFTPYGLELYLFLKKFTNTVYLTTIAEWLPFYYLPIQYKQLIYAAIFLSVLFLVAFLIYEFKKRERRGMAVNIPKLNLWYLAISFLFLLMALKSKRHFPLFFVSSFPLLIYLLVNYLGEAPELILKIANKKILYFFLAGGLFFGAAGLLADASWAKDPFRAPYFCSDYPCRAIDFINSPDLKNKKLLNDYGWGGFMIWTHPERKLFIDGRLPQFPYNEHTLLHEYLSFFSDKVLEEKLNEHGIELVHLKLYPYVKFNWFEKYILKFDEKEFNDQKRDLLIYLNESENWDLIYEDELSHVYLKNN